MICHSLFGPCNERSRLGWVFMTKKIFVKAELNSSSTTHWLSTNIGKIRLNHIIWGIKVLTYHSNNGGNPLVFWNTTILKSLGKFLKKFPRWRAFFTMLNSISNLSQDFQSALHMEHLRGSTSVWRSAKYFHSSDKNWPHQKRLSGVAYKCKSSFRNMYQYSKEISLVSRAIFGMSFISSVFGNFLV